MKIRRYQYVLPHGGIALTTSHLLARVGTGRA